MESRKNIVIVDDEKDILTLFPLVFEDSNFNIWCFETVEEVYELMKSHKVDVLITDLVLKNVDDGMDLIQHFNENYPDVKVFVMSGFLTKDRLSKLDKLKVADISAKPFKMMVFGDKVKNYLGLNTF